MDTATNFGPLHGNNVVEPGNRIATPFAKRSLADIGAEVTTVERPEGGGETRRWRRSRDATSMVHRTIPSNRSKH